jgi:hypothetical protein
MNKQIHITLKSIENQTTIAGVFGGVEYEDV